MSWLTIVLTAILAVLVLILYRLTGILAAVGSTNSWLKTIYRKMWES